MNNVKSASKHFFQKYPAPFLLLSPLLFYVVLQLTIIPAMLLAAIVVSYTGSCQDSTFLCGFNEAFYTLIGLNVLAVYSLTLYIFNRMYRPTKQKLIITAALLAMYYAGILFVLYLNWNAKLIADK